MPFDPTTPFWHVDQRGRRILLRELRQLLASDPD
jgi:hypothetical protein